MNISRGFSMIILVVIIFLGIVVFFIPLPFFVKSNEFTCLSLDCPKQGLNWGPSLYNKFYDKVSDKSRYYVGDSDSCAVIEYACPEGYQGFADDNGCGCERKLTNEPEDSNDVLEWKTFTNEYDGFSFSYPSTLTSEEHQAGSIVLIENPSDSQSIRYHIDVRQGEINPNPSFNYTELPYNGKIIRFSCRKNVCDSDEHNRILSSFKFDKDSHIYTSSTSLFSIQLHPTLKFLNEHEILDEPSLSPRVASFSTESGDLRITVKSWDGFPEVIWGENYTIENYASEMFEKLEMTGPYIPVLVEKNINQLKAYEISNYFDKVGKRNIFVYLSSAKKNYEINCQINEQSEVVGIEICNQAINTMTFND